MPPSAKVAATSKSGIQTTATGDSFIPSSTRPDGSKRKEIRVRPGYRPPEDVEVYKNRTAEAWKNRGKGGVPGAEPASHQNVDAKSDNQNKNAKRREARKKAAAATNVTGSHVEPDVIEIPGATNGQASHASELAEPVAPNDEEIEKEKKARNLKKKLKQAKDLRQKKDKGEPLLPEQFTKVMKIHELIRELDLLGFDADGEKRETTEE
ncbi:MAG: hypothetical protein Q9160_002120 [Pyrenula sp. 1 TL-2023]